MKQGTILLLGFALALGVPNALILHKEHVLASGNLVLLELAPVDPRSLMQGDYMRLAYRIVRNLPDTHDWPSDGELVLIKDANGVGQFVRRNEPGIPLGPGEFRLRYRRRGWTVRLGAEAYYFQEGQADHFQRAKYGALRVTDAAESVLVGLCDADRNPIVPGAPEPTPAPPRDE